MNCSRNLNKYRISRTVKDWRQFKNMVKRMKQNFFNLKIQETANKKGS